MNNFTNISNYISLNIFTTNNIGCVKRSRAITTRWSENDEFKILSTQHIENKMFQYLNFTFGNQEKNQVST